MKTVITLFGTRPEIIKVAPVVWALERKSPHIRNVNVCSSQHTSLLRPFVTELGIRIDHDLGVMTPSQAPSDVLARVVTGMSRIIDLIKPDLILVQGDTTTAFAGAIAAFYGKVPVGHVEAGLRTQNRFSPFPEEMNRRLITQLADLHFAATKNNASTLRNEGVAREAIYLTGNPVVDTLQHVLGKSKPSQALAGLLRKTRAQRLVVLTTHRRENFGTVMSQHLNAVRNFAARHGDVAVVFPVHPNPAVRQAVSKDLGHLDNIHCIDPLNYSDFLQLLSRSWIIISDSGGIQEEAPSLGKRLLVLRDTTERPEVIESGLGQLVGHSGKVLEEMLEEALRDTDAGVVRFSKIRNPFGDGSAGVHIADVVERYLHARDHPTAAVNEARG